MQTIPKSPVTTAGRRGITPTNVRSQKVLREIKTRWQWRRPARSIFRDNNSKVPIFKMADMDTATNPDRSARRPFGQAFHLSTFPPLMQTPTLCSFATSGTHKGTATGVSAVDFGMHAIGATSRIMGGSTATSRREPHSDHSRFKALPPYAENQHVNILSLELHLREHPDRSAVNFILEGLRSGFRIGFRGQLSDTSRPNNKSALENSRIVTNAVQKEVAREHTAGPFLSPPFPINHISPLGAVPKKDGTCRIVFDLSQPEGESINDFIFKEEYPCSYTHFDEATELTLLMGRGCFLSKIDIKHAYRLLPVHPRDWPLLVYRWQEHFYVDLKLPFGCRSSASIFTAFADLVCWILRHHYRLTVIHYSDDFLIVTGPDRALAQKHQDTFKEVFWRLWIPCADDKTVGPSTKLPFLGISISTTDFTLSIPEEKVNILQELPRWCTRKACTKRELSSCMAD